jgi:hypothetical protein
MSIRARPSPHLRNCTSEELPGFHRRFHLSGRASVLSLWFAPLAAHSGLAAASISGLHRPEHPLANPAIPARFPAGSSVVGTVRPFDLWIQVQKSHKFVDITQAGACDQNKAGRVTVF